MKLSKNTKIIVAIIATAILVITGIALASTIITAPEHVTGTPQPTPSPSPSPAELHLTSNNTAPFYIGDTLHLVAQLTPAQAGITVTLYNNGEVKGATQTDSNGIAVFDRQPTLPFDYTASAELP